MQVYPWSLTPASCQDNLLRKIADCKLSFDELKQHSSEINDLQVPKTEFLKKTGCKSWKEASERYLACLIDFYNPKLFSIHFKNVCSCIKGRTIKQKMTVVKEPDQNTTQNISK